MYKFNWIEQLFVAKRYDYWLLELNFGFLWLFEIKQCNLNKIPFITITYDLITVEKQQIISATVSGIIPFLIISPA